MSRLNKRPKKSLGQNFLTDQHYAEKIIAAIPDDLPVMEIGPGKGVLTKYLVKKCPRYIGIELDRDLYGFLAKYFVGEQIHFMNNDILKTDINSLFENTEFNVVGNIPYNITTPIIFHLLENAKQISHIVLMVQKEVADRITAKPGNKIYGVLSIMTQFIAETEFLFKVPAGAFFPIPKVESAVIKLKKRTWAEQRPVSPEFFKEIVRKAFQQRRKMLRSSLKGLPLEATCIDLRLRPEQLSISDWIKFSNELYNQ